MAKRPRQVRQVTLEPAEFEREPVDTDAPDEFDGDLAAPAGLAIPVDFVGDVTLAEEVATHPPGNRAPDLVAVPVPSVLPCRVHGDVVPAKAGQTNQMTIGRTVRTWYRFRCPRCDAPRFAVVDTPLAEVAPHA